MFDRVLSNHHNRRQMPQACQPQEGRTHFFAIPKAKKL